MNNDQTEQTNDSTESERFVDEALETPIPPKHLWDELSPNELIDVRNQLEDKLWTFGNNPTIAKALRSGIAQLNAMISSHAKF